jgi:hypothetical protein
LERSFCATNPKPEEKKMNPTIFPCLADAQEVLVEYQPLRRPVAVRVNGELAKLSRRYFFKIGTGKYSLTQPPERVAVVTIGGRRVAIVSERDVFYPAARL